MHQLDADVIIIGAGLAGLTAAYHILQKEPTLIVYILESSNSIGGRLHSVPLLVQNGDSVSFFNISGDRICPQQTQLLRLLKKMDVSTHINNNMEKIIVQYKEKYETSDRKDILGFLTVIEKIELTKFILKVETICHTLTTKRDLKLLSELSRINLRDFITDTIKSKSVQTVIEYIILYNCGCNIYEISALFYIFFCISTKGIVNQLWFNEDNLYELKMKNSPYDIRTRLAEEIGAHNIKTRQTVLDIINKGKYVKVITESKVYYCSHIIVSVSPKQLLKIKFKPALPGGTLSYVEDTCSSIVTHFVVTYPTEFWKERNLSGELHIIDRNYSQGPIIYCENVSKRKRAALKGYIVSERYIENDKVPFYKQRVLEQLSDYFGEEALNPTDYYEKSWFEDAPYMSCWKLGNTFHRNVVTTSERIYFAGSESSTIWYGFMAGAVDSGIRAAREVMYNLRPSSLTADELHCLRPLMEDDVHSRILPWRLNWRLKIVAMGLTTLGVWKLMYYIRRMYKYFLKKINV